MEKNAALHHYGMAMSHKHESVVSATMQGRLDVNIAKAILFWGLMLVTMMTTLLMIYKGAPIYIFSDTNIDRMTVSPWWLLIGFEAPIIVGFLVRGQWGNISNVMLGAASFCLMLDFYVHITMITTWDLTAKFELAHIILFAIAAFFGGIYRKAFP